MPTRPDAVVAVVIRQGRILVIRRAKGVRHPGMWAPPSGKVEAGERQADAVIREMREEIGLEVRPILQVWECLSADGTHTLHWWLSDCEKGALRPDPREVRRGLAHLRDRPRVFRHGLSPH